MSESWHPAGIAVEPCEPRPEVDLVEPEDEIDVGPGHEQSGGLTEQAGDVVGSEARIFEPGPAAEEELGERRRWTRLWAAPVVGWPQDTIVRSPRRSAPSGATTTPDTAMSAPVTSVEW